MPQYLSPGVYVEEVPSAVKPIAGVSTSTAGFIGIVAEQLAVPPTFATRTQKIIGPGGTTDVFDLDAFPVVTAENTYEVRVGNQQVAATLENTTDKSTVKLTDGPPPKDAVITVDYTVDARRGIEIGTWAGTTKKFTLPTKGYPVVTDSNWFKIAIGDDAEKATEVVARLDNTIPKSGADAGKVVPIATITGKVDEALKTKKIFADFRTFQPFKPTAAVGEAKLCTNFTEYKTAFGDFSLDEKHRQLTHAVYGFFNNGGTRCYVARMASEADIGAAISAFELIDEISIVAAPGLITDAIRSKVVTHCEQMGNRFAILDGPESEETLTKLTTVGGSGLMPGRTDYGAWYFPWIKVFDPVAKKYAGSEDGLVGVPPSGHIAGVYARVDNERGVHKAPANETIRGALDVTQRLSKAHQDGLNPKGVNCIRLLNDNILVWGARTVGGDANTDMKYINVRRTLIFLRESIDLGTQWVVFEPNSPALWQRISRTVTAFLTNVWRSGALFGDTPAQAFYVKCDKETNPQSSIDAGRVVTEIGVAIVRPAEFVIFRISQMAGGGS
jgi:phage tail sheath protein FI